MRDERQATDPQTQKANGRKKEAMPETYRLLLSDDPRELAEQVTQAAQEGFTPSGGISFIRSQYAQAMYRALEQAPRAEKRGRKQG